MGKKCKWNRFVLILVVFAMFGFAQGVNAQCPPVQLPPPLLTGPENPVNGFPLWMMDETGLALQICLDADNCFFDAVDPDNPFSVQVEFGPEAFWWLSSATLETLDADGNTFFDALVVMGAEAAWIAENPKDGDQFPFTRLRIRIDTPFFGTYTVTHPYGTDVFTVDAGRRAVNESFDIPVPAPTFGFSHESRIGNFLYWDTLGIAPPIGPPTGFIGDGAMPHAVLGSPCGAAFNKFRVDAEDALGNPIDLDPLTAETQSFVETTLFMVQGQIYTGTPTIVDRSTYSRNQTGQVDVTARALTDAALEVSSGLVIPSTLMEDDGAGNYFVHVPGLTSASIPASVTVTSNPPTVNPFGYAPETNDSPLVDIVTISRAVYDPTPPGMLTVMASSTDKFAPPTLTAVDIGVLVDGTLTAVTVPFPPTTVTVNSTAGGSATAPVIIVSNPLGVCEGDFNGDGDQDGLDLDPFALDYGRNDCP